MNPFEILKAEPKLQLDSSELRSLYLQAIRAEHPDKYMGNPELLQNAEARSAMIHQAYAMLLDPWQRLSVILEMNNFPASEQLSPDFLMEMMDLNEKVSDSDGSDSADLLEEIAEQEKQILEKYEQAALLYDGGEKTVLSELTDLRGRMKYILRLKERITKFASRF